MAIEYTVYANVEAYDESKLKTAEDDCRRPCEERILYVTNDLRKAKNFLVSLKTDFD
jgi:hypothetical protein